MPKLLDPDSCTFDVVLRSDADKQPKPTFVFRALSARAFTRLAEVYDGLDALPTEKDRIEAVIMALRDGLIGWRDMGRDYDAEQLPDILTLSEAIELLQSMMAGQQLDVDEAKN